MIVKNKKRFIWLFVVPIIIIFSILSIYYFVTTMSPNQCIDYCLKHTERNAEKFTRVNDGSYKDGYSYYIAADGDSDKQQEVFIFKKKSLGLSILDRYVYIMSSTESNSNIYDENRSFGAVQFFKKNDRGEKESGATLLFYGACKDSSIVSYEYTLTVREGSNVYKGYAIVKADGVWFIKFSNLVDYDETSKKLVSDFKFYDSDGNLVAKY